MPSSLRTSYENVKAQTKTPVWTFSGLFVIGIFIVAGIIAGKQKDEKNAKLIASPQSGDVFEIKTPGGRYTLYKVAEVHGDSVFVRMNDLETNKVSGLSELRKKGDIGYSEELYNYTKTELKQMLDKGEIIDIDR